MSKNNGVIVDTLFVAATRPTTIGGVTFTAFMLNMLIVIEFFAITRNLLWLGLFAPLHVIFYLICRHDLSTFDLIGLWAKTRAANFRGFNPRGNKPFWQSSSYSPLAIHRQKKYHKGVS